MEYTKLEKTAIDAIRDYIRDCKQLVPYIDSDQTSMWDGDIYIYDSEEINNKNFIGRFPMIIKAQRTEQQPQNEIKYRFPLDKLEMYKKEGGCVLFVVQFCNYLSFPNYTINYRILKKDYIDELLNNSNYKQSATINLYRLPKRKEFVEELRKCKEENKEWKPIQVLPLINFLEDLETKTKEIKDELSRIIIQEHIDSILNLKYNNTSHWRDKIIAFTRIIINESNNTLNPNTYANLVFEVAKTLQGLNIFQLAEKYYKELLENYLPKLTLDTNSKKIFEADILNLIGLLHCDTNVLTEAKKELECAFDLYKNYGEKGSDSCLINVSIILNNIGLVFNKLNQPNKAIEKLLEASIIYEELTKEAYSTYLPFFANLLCNLGESYRISQDYESAELKFEEALSICEKIEEKKDDILHVIARIYNNQGLIYQSLDNNSFASAKFEESTSIFKGLADNNPDTYLPDFAKVLINAGTIYIHTKNYKQAEKDLSEAYRILKELSPKAPDVFNPFLANVLNSLGGLYHDIHKNKDAEEKFREALYIWRDLTAKNPDAYKSFVAETLDNLAIFHRNNKDFAKAEEEYLEAISKYKELFQSSSVNYYPKIADLSNSLGNLYREKFEFKSAEKAYSEALEIYRDLMEQKTNAYLPNIAETLNNLGSVHELLHDYTEAETQYKEALNIYRDLENHSPNVYLPKIAETLCGIGKCFEINITTVAYAEDNYLEALSIYKELSKNDTKFLIKVGYIYNVLADINSFYKDNYEHELYYRLLALNIFTYSIDDEKERDLESMCKLINDIIYIYAPQNSCYNEEILSLLKGLSYKYPDFKLYIFDIQYKIAEWYYKDEKYSQAESLYKKLLKSLDIQSYTSDETNLILATIYKSLGSINYKRKYIEAATDYYKKSINICLQLADEDACTIFLNKDEELLEIGIKYYKDEDYEKAEEMFMNLSKLYYKLSYKNAEHYLPLDAYVHNFILNIYTQTKGTNSNDTKNKRKELQEKFFDFAKYSTNKDKKFAFTVSLPESKELSINFNFGRSNEKDVLNRIIAIIGENGARKTTVLSQLAGSIASLNLNRFQPDYPLFSKAITISYSAFDKLYDIEDNEFNFAYCGIKHKGRLMTDIQLDKRRLSNIKSIQEISRWQSNNREQDLYNFLSNVVSKELLEELFCNDNDSKKIKTESVNDVIRKMSSGENILTNIIIDLLANIIPNSLVLIDEPEIHLHPTAITDFINIINDICIKYSSCCIMATHSPLVIQSILSRNVIILERIDNEPEVRKMRIESFGENLTTISEEIFGNSSKEKLYQKILKKLVESNNDYDQIEKLLQNEGLPLSLSSYMLINRLLKSNDKLQ